NDVGAIVVRCETKGDASAGSKSTAVLTHAPGQRVRVGAARIAHQARQANGSAFWASGGSAKDRSRRVDIGDGDGLAVSAHAGVIVGRSQRDYIATVVVRGKREARTGTSGEGGAVLGDAPDQTLRIRTTRIANAAGKADGCALQAAG